MEHDLRGGRVGQGEHEKRQEVRMEEGEKLQGYCSSPGKRCDEALIREEAEERKRWIQEIVQDLELLS